MAIEENNDFLNQKKEHKTTEKPVRKIQSETTGKSVGAKKGFEVPVMTRTLNEKEKADTRKKYEFVINKVKQIEKREIDEKYKAYKELNDYSRRCLIATNYWRVMWGSGFIDVPTQDVRFWFYFDVKCFEDAPYWQKIKKPEFEERNRLEAEAEQKILSEKTANVKDADVKKTEPAPEPEKIIEPEKKEPEVVAKKKEDEMLIEENKDFLSQKQEHPVYPKRENKTEKKKGQKEKQDSELKSENTEPEQKKKPQPKGKGKNKNDDTQYNLF